MQVPEFEGVAVIEAGLKIFTVLKRRALKQYITSLSPVTVASFLGPGYTVVGERFAHRNVDAIKIPACPGI